MKDPRRLVRAVWRRTLHNLPQKALAALLAGGLWFVATGERRETTERSFNVRVQQVDDTSTNPAGERRSVSLARPTVRVTLSGPRTTLQGLSGDELDATVTVTNQPEGDFQVPVRVRVPEGLRLVGVDPGTVSGFIDTEITRTLPINLAATNLPERALPDYELTPNTVRVTGPQDRAEAIARVFTVPVSLARGASAEVRLVALDANGRPVTDVRLDPATVTVERTDRVDLPLRTLRVTLPPPPAALELISAELDPPSVRVIADPATLSRLANVVARVPYREGRYSAVARLQLPAGVRSLDTVTVTLDVRKRGANP